MKTFKAIAFLTILVFLSLSTGYVFAEPPAESARPAFGEHPDIQKYKEQIAKEPGNFEPYLKLAGIYAGTGDGDLALENVEKALKLNPEAAIAQDAYMIGAMGAYYAGEFKKSYEYTEKALQVNPENKMAISFKNMLEEVSKQQWGGKFPEKVSWYGYKSAGEFGRARMREGVVNLGEKEDRFTSESLSFKVTSPPNWHKASEVPMGSGAPALIVYSKTGKEIAPPVMAITRDTPDMQDKRAVEFTVRMKAVIAKTLPDVVFEGPSEEIVNGRYASHMVFKGQTPKGTLRTEWYQFLEKGTIITFDFIQKG